MSLLAADKYDIDPPRGKFIPKLIIILLFEMYSYVDVASSWLSNSTRKDACTIKFNFSVHANHVVIDMVIGFMSAVTCHLGVKN